MRSQPSTRREEPREEELSEAIRRAARRFEERAATLAATIAEAIHAQMSEFGSSTAVTASTRASVRGGIAGFARMLQQQDPSSATVRVPPEALDYVDAYVRRGLDISLLLRTYRLGHQHMWRGWRDVVAEEDVTPEQALAILERTDEAMFMYMDALVGTLLDHYRTERERWRQSAGAMRLETVRALVAGDPMDAETASRRLRYELDRHHVAVVAWDPAGAYDQHGRVEEVARTVAERLGDPRPLVVAAGRSVAWAWAGSREPPPADRLDRVAGESAGVARAGGAEGASGTRPGEATEAGGARAGDVEDAPVGTGSEDAAPEARGTIRVALGEPARGVDGFRRSHEEALAARRVLQTGAVRLGPVVRWNAVALLGLLTADADRAAQFVADELGQLATGDDAMVRLRETLWCFFQEGEHVKHTAARLGVHQNTVAYRLRQAEELLGRPIRTRPVELQAALLVCDWLGGADGAIQAR